MTEEKQIEEMAKVIERTGMLESFLGCEVVAYDLYEDGYRKQSEGEWIAQSEAFVRFECSKCHSYNHIVRSKYCPNCGAKMKGG